MASLSAHQSIGELAPLVCPSSPATSRLYNEQRSAILPHPTFGAVGLLFKASHGISSALTCRPAIALAAGRDIGVSCQFFPPYSPKLLAASRAMPPMSISRSKAAHGISSGQPQASPPARSCPTAVLALAAFDDGKTTQKLGMALETERPQQKALRKRPGPLSDCRTPPKTQPSSLSAATDCRPLAHPNRHLRQRHAVLGTMSAANFPRPRPRSYTGSFAQNKVT